MTVETKGILNREGVLEDLIEIKAKLGDKAAYEAMRTKERIEHANMLKIPLPEEDLIDFIRLSRKVIESFIGKVGFDYPPSK